MRSFRYIHVGGLRLDSPLTGLSGAVPDTVNQCLAAAGFTALSRLMALCERERPDALLLSGNTFCAVERHLSARLRLLEVLAALERMGVRVCVAPGRNDPASAWASIRHLPAAVTVFDAEPGSVELLREGRLVATVHGRAWREGFSDAEPLLWVQAHEEGQVPADAPSSAWNAPVQGLGFHEEGEHGCTVVAASVEQNIWTFAERFEPLGPVVWSTEVLSSARGASEEAPPENGFSGLDGCAELATRLAKRLDAQLDRLWPGCELLVLRLVLEPEFLRTDSSAWREHLREKLNEILRGDEFAGEASAANLPLLWVAELDMQESANPAERASAGARPSGDMLAGQSRQDLVGELQRLNDSLRSSDEALNAAVERALAPLLTGKRVGLDLRPDGHPEGAGQARKKLLDCAERLCLNKLQNSLEGGELSRGSGNDYSRY